LLNSRLPEINLAIELNIPFIIMPQTIGPFLNEVNKDRIITLLKRADRIYVRDDNFIDELKKHNLTYVKTKDLSYFMKPQPFDIEIKKPCVGINVSGLAYSNKFGNLAGQFDNYPKIITELIKRFQKRNYNIYIIPHSYNVNKPEVNNDDMESSKLFYDSLYNKKGVYFVERDLISPQLKYLISQMDFFVGTRMHANFAAIFTNTPAFGLAYSYKFKSAFENNGIFNRTIDINNVSSFDVNKVVETIENAFVEDVLKKKS
jgi:polysaccharide pyruvyl transferase WcaK-like protein